MKRISFIDISRAIAIVLIVLGHTIVHSKHCSVLFKIIYSFHVPLFFIISGYLFKIKNESFLIFIKNKFIRLLIPYFFWSAIFLIPYFIFGSNVAKNIDINTSFDLKQMIINIFYGNGNNNALKQNSALWFLPAMFSMEFIFYWIIKITSKINKKFVLLSLIIITIVSDLFLTVYLPFGINTVLNMGLYFYIGYLSKTYNIFESIKYYKWYYILLLFILGLLAALFNSNVFPIEYQYGNIILFGISSICLSFVIIWVSCIIEKDKLLSFIGTKTMEILIFHKFLIVIFQTKIRYISSFLINSNFFIEFFISIIIVILTIVISLVSGLVINEICPFLLGKKEK